MSSVTPPLTPLGAPALPRPRALGQLWSWENITQTWFFAVPEAARFPLPLGSWRHQEL